MEDTVLSHIAMAPLGFRKFVQSVRSGSSKIKVRIIASLLIPLSALITTEWIHRDTLFTEKFLTEFIEHLSGFFLAWLFFFLLYAAVSLLTGWHGLATAVVGLTGHIPAAITYFKLQLRGEPFLPWDIPQFMEASNVVGKANLELRPSMAWTLALFVALTVAASFLDDRKRKREIRSRLRRTGTGILFAVLLALQIFGIYLQPAVTTYLGIIPDMWMQNRFYANYGVVSGFLTNLQALHISKPDGYSQENLSALKDLIEKSRPTAPLYQDSYAATTASAVKQPNIIYIMCEAFWDVTELDGIVFDREITPTLDDLKERAAVGRSYSPSFGGGTCDVEFEALTGYSMEHLPAGSKPYQQHVTHTMPALPNYLKGQGYNTLAIHGYYRKYWSRDKAYPYLGIDRFISAENFVNPERKRSFYWKGGLISDAEVGNRIITEFEQRDKSKPLFLHAVTMQNHSSYNEKNYPAEELVKILDAPADISQETLSQLRDFATGIHEADAMLGNLIDYFSHVEEPTILVFWGDHYNTIGRGYELYEKTGYIAKGDVKSPSLRGTPLVIWSNYSNQAVDLGTIGAYNISPVMMDLYGLEKPLYFDALLEGMSLYRARTRGITVEPDGSFSETMTQVQQQWFDRHWLLQYDLMFGENDLGSNIYS